MIPPRLTRTIALAAVALALAGMGVLTACGTKGKPAEDTPSPSTTTVLPSATDKSVTGALTPEQHPSASFAPSASPGR